ncbi:hypothetical protein GC176_24220 [bacterium]|nr:hypothetical protein [bacterium]
MTLFSRKNSLIRLVTAAAIVAGMTLSNAALRADGKDDAKRIERLLVRAQVVCPVTGKDLTSMGGPVRATVSKATVILCCKGCFGKKIPSEHWETVTANLIKAQGRCPVMDKPLPKDPKSVVVEGRRIFVCCPPCTKKIEDDPKKYIAAVDRLLEKNLGDDK